MLRQLSGGTSIHKESMGIAISTAPINQSKGIYKSMDDRGERILTGEAEHGGPLPTFFKLPAGSDGHDKSIFWMPNPNMGVTFSDSWLFKEYEQAKNDPDNTALANFMSQHLNICSAEVFGTDRWIPLQKWDELANPRITLPSPIEESEWIWVGADAGLRDDPTCITVMGKGPGVEQYSIWSHQWLHVDGYNKRRQHVAYDDFVKSGELAVCTREGQDMSEMLGIIIDHLEGSGKLVAVGLDAHKMQTLMDTLEDRGIQYFEVPQGWQMTKFIVATDRMFYENKIKHSGGPMLRFNFANVQLQERGRGLALTKPGEVSSRKLKIDGAVCVVMGVAASMQHKPADVGSMIG